MAEFGDERLPARFWAKASPEPNSGCWLWAGAINEKGYGGLWFGDRLERAHRLSYEFLVADFPREWIICHRCQSRLRQSDASVRRNPGRQHRRHDREGTAQARSASRANLQPRAPPHFGKHLGARRLQGLQTPSLQAEEIELMATQLAERRANPLQVFRETLSQPAFREQMKMALPSHIPVERFERVALTAVQNSPALLDANKVDRHSLFGALMKAAQDGLLPDGREGAIVPYKGKAQWQPMVAGIMSKVRRSGEIANWETAAVFEKDTFQRLLGDDQRIYHEPFEEGDPGKVIGAYSIVTFKDGTKSRDYMPRWRIEKAREQAMAKDSLMWSKFYDEGAIKTVIKHHSKRLPMSTDLDGVFANDDSLRHVAAPEPDTPKLAAVPEAPVSRLDALEHHIEDGADDETGEVLDQHDETVDMSDQADAVEAELIDDDDTDRDAFGLKPLPETQAEEPQPEPTLADQAVTAARAGTAAAKNASYLKSIDDTWQLAKAAVDDATAAEIDALIAAKRREFQGGEG